MPKCRHGHGRRSSSSQRCLPCRRTAFTRRPTRARRKRAGATPSKTIGSSATWASTMRRPAATLCAARRAASTSGSSGMVRGAGAQPSPSCGAGPAVDHDGLAVHERGRGGREEDAGIGDLLDLAPPAHAHAGRHRVVGLLGRGRVLLGEHAHVALGLHRSGGDAVHADALAAPGHAELAGEVDHRGLGGAVVRHHGRAVDARDRRDVDDGAAAAAGPSSACPPTCSRRRCR